MKRGGHGTVVGGHVVALLVAVLPTDTDAARGRCAAEGAAAVVIMGVIIPVETTCNSAGCSHIILVVVLKTDIRNGDAHSEAVS